jgi:hypothetical protein
VSLKSTIFSLSISRKLKESLNKRRTGKARIYGRIYGSNILIKLGLLHQGLIEGQQKLVQYYGETSKGFGYFYGFAVLLNPHQKESFWNSRHFSAAYDAQWEVEYWVEFEKLYKAEYANRVVQTRRIPANLKKLSQQAPDFDAVMDQIANIRHPQVYEVPDATEAEVELIDYRQYSKLLW